MLEAEKPHDLSSVGWRPKRANCVGFRLSLKNQAHQGQEIDVPAQQSGREKIQPLSTFLF